MNAGSILLTDEYRYKILKMLESNPAVSQRELAEQLGISLGKVNFCLKALVNVGLLKVTNFRNNKNKLAYMYLLTPSGIEEKALITMRFLKNKITEYESIKNEIDRLTEEINHSKSSETVPVKSRRGNVKKPIIK
jgi:EPS-associated MarR family transcriptional regulator